MDSKLFETPHNQQDENGNVVAPAGEVAFQPQKWAEADLRRDHDFSASSILVSTSVQVESLELSTHRDDIPTRFYISNKDRANGIRKVREIRQNLKTNQDEISNK